jgi:hypothetical protein
MPFNLIWAIKSTHRHPINRVLHCIGLPLYVIGFALAVGYFTDLHANPITEITLWLIAVGLFLTGHKIEGNLRAMTLIILFKYFKSKKRILTTGIRR